MNYKIITKFFFRFVQISERIKKNCAKYVR